MTKLTDSFGLFLSSVPHEALAEEKRLFSIRGSGTREPRSCFGFMANRAVEWLVAREKIDTASALQRLQTFLNAHLLHFPDNRMNDTIKNEAVEMQPTAKGLAVLEQWFRANGTTLNETQQSAVRTMLASPYNTMELLCLERTLMSEKLQTTTGLAMWVWHRMLGEHPNVFDGRNDKEYKMTERKDLRSVFNPNTVNIGSLDTEEEAAKVIPTPYWNSAIYHPSTSSLMQYWDSRGMKVFKTLSFQRPLKSKFASAVQYKAPMCFSGKAMWQWIMDCTTVESSAEAMSIVRLFFDQYLIEPITDRLLSFATCEDDLPSLISRSTFYKFTKRGMRLCAWEGALELGSMEFSEKDRDETNAVRWMMLGGPSEADLANASSWAWMFIEKPEGYDLDDVFRHLVTMSVINSEPGLKIPFRQRLVEWHCDENLRFNDDARRTLLLVKAFKSSEGTITRRTRLLESVEKATAELCRLYFATGAPFELNVSQTLREEFMAAFHGMQGPDVIDQLKPQLETIQAECVAFLDQQVTQFVSDDEVRSLPFNSYIVGCYKKYGPETVQRLEALKNRQI